ncbi:response regulator [Polaribacter sp.]|uniref:response regulator n=1 Tax=Polaribacter sp. TaxID=1920175 RepID=UPI0040487667
MKKQLDILLIEDNFLEIMKMKRTLSLLELNHSLTEAKDAEIALEILQGNNRFPDLILLDLNMPKISGIEFLEILKSSENFRHIPTVILTTSDNKTDLEECYKIGVSGYILKPLKYEDYVKKIEAVLTYWSMNELKRY